MINDIQNFQHRIIYKTIQVNIFTTADLSQWNSTKHISFSPRDCNGALEPLRTIRQVTVNYFSLWEKLLWNNLFILFMAFCYSRVGIWCCVCLLQPTASNSPLVLLAAARLFPQLQTKICVCSKYDSELKWASSQELGLSPFKGTWTYSMCGKSFHV